MAVRGQRLHAQVENWLSKLVDLSRRNRLVYFRESKRMTLRVAAPSAGELLDRVGGNGRPHRFWVPPPSSERYVPRRDETEENAPDQDVARQMGLVCDDERPRYALETSQLNWHELATTLKRMSSKADLDLAERGVRILHLAFGMLEWRDEETPDAVRSPIVMVPVELRRESRKDPWELGVCDEDIVLNPVLAVKMQRDFKIELPAIPADWEEVSLDGYLASVMAAVPDTPWFTSEEAWLGLFSFHKLPMYQDLATNRPRLGTHAIVTRLAGEQTERDPQTEPVVDAGTLDPNLHPRDSLLVVDADSSQLAAIETVKLGTSLVLHGPPGTGKSQTITNVIAETLAAGKSLLFVSEKMAALEVVYGRIAESGLDHLCLELHSHKASRKAVVEALHKAMTERLTATGGLSADDLERLFERREQLNDYVAALHAVRQPFGRSVFDVIGELSDLRSAPERPTDESWVSTITADRYDWLGQVAARLGGMWGPVAERQAFPWYGFGCDRLDAPLLASQVDAAGRAVAEAETQVVNMASGMAMEPPASLAQASVVPQIAALCANRPGVERTWLTSPAARSLPNRLREARRLHDELGTRLAALTDRQGSDFVSAADIEHVKALDELCAVLSSRLGLFTHEGRLSIDTPVAYVMAAAEWLLDLRDRAAAVGGATGELASVLGLREQSITLRRGLDLVKLSAICTQAPKPLRDWLTNAGEEKPASRSAELSLKVREWRDAVAMTLEAFDESVFELDVRALSERYEGEHRGLLAFLRPQFWRDGRAVRACSKRRLSRDEVQGLLGSAVRAEALGRECDDVGPALLGPHYHGSETDLDAVETALQHAAQACKLLARTGSSSLLLDLLSSEVEPPEDVTDAASRLKALLQRLTDSSEDAHVGPIQDVWAEGRERLVDIELGLLGKWLDEVGSRLAGPLALVRDAYGRGRATSLATVSEFARDLEEACRVRALQDELQAGDADLKDLCGGRYQGPWSDWESLIAGLEWAIRIADAFQAAGVDLLDEFVAWASAEGDTPDAHDRVRVVMELLDAARHSIGGLGTNFAAGTFRIDGLPPEEASFGQLRDRLRAMAARLPDLDDWVDAARTRATLAEAGLPRFAAALWDAPPDSTELVACVRASALRGWLRVTYASDPRLSEFRVEDHERLVREFRDLDRRHWELGAARVVSKAASKQTTSGYVPAGSERAVLLKEAHKKRRHLPIRALFEQIRGLILELKPCLLMSPLSVSQFLPPDLCFDVVVFDEASQICTEDAIGAIYRGKQVLICGDQRQLPPTDFFQKTLDDEAEEFSPDEDVTIESYESVLDECLATGMQESWLRWHYRSRDERLIVFSNDRFYDYRLVTFPSARGDDARLGVEFVYVPAGVYDRGGKRTNVVEGRRVVDIALEHLARHPDKTLGVVSFSISQTQAIEDEIERRAAGNSSLDAIVMRGRQNGFFVKNLENVQGDERDVMLFSIGYGRDRGGRLWMTFGPLNQPGGERRLNVAVTRARERVILVSSIRAADLDLTATQSPGVRHLHAYLDFAERGVGALREAPNFGSREYESPLEADVAGEVRRLGYDVDAQVGCSGYRIDLGVRAPGHPGRYILGIECDGATYHSACTARDRDRLRQQVLEAQGWRIHRIWSPAWLRRRDGEVERLHEAIRAAERDSLAVAAAGGAASVEPRVREVRPPVSTVAIEMDADAAFGGPTWARPYTPCELPFLPWSDHEFHDPSCTPRHSQDIARVVEEEGPVHIDVVARRLAAAWGLQRVGSRMRDAVEYAARLVVRRLPVERRGEFLWPSTPGFELTVRTPTSDDPLTERKPEHIPDEEIVLAMQQLARDGGGIQEDALISETARLFGISRVGHQVRARFESVLRRAIAQGHLGGTNGAVQAD